MNELSNFTSTVPGEGDDEEDTTTLHITVTAKTASEMTDIYGFNMVEQVGLHEIAIALIVVRSQAAIFVQVHGANLGKDDVPLLTPRLDGVSDALVLTIRLNSSAFLRRSPKSL